MNRFFEKWNSKKTIPMLIWWLLQKKIITENQCHSKQLTKNDNLKVVFLTTKQVLK
jgi:hypothetical protein